MADARAYNSRITSESLEAKFRDFFPSQGGAELVDDLYASGVIQPVVDFTTTALGQQLPSYLQTAWDFTTQHATITNSSSTLVSNAGFWKFDLNCNYDTAAVALNAYVEISDGLSVRKIWEINTTANSDADSEFTQSHEFYVFLRSGDSISATSNNSQIILDLNYRQVADLNGNPVNPKGFSPS